MWQESSQGSGDSRARSEWIELPAETGLCQVIGGGNLHSSKTVFS